MKLNQFTNNMEVSALRLGLIALVLSLAACSSSSDDADNTVEDDAQTTDPAVDAGASDISDDGGSGQSALFGPAEYVVSECGSLPVSSTVPNNSLTNPMQLSVGEPVRGQLVPNSVDNDFHSWQVQLEPGNYHVVADASTIAEGSDYIGMHIESLGATNADNEILTSEATNDYDLRLYRFLEIQVATTMTIKLSALSESVHDYTFGIFPNGSAVPSPTLDACLPVSTLSVDSTESVDLRESGTREDDQWFAIDLEEQLYTLDAASRSAESELIGYDFVLFTQYGQTAAMQQITHDGELATELVTSDEFESPSAAQAWIRVRNIYESDRTIEFTVGTP